MLRGNSQSGESSCHVAPPGFHRIALTAPAGLEATEALLPGQGPTEGWRSCYWKPGAPRAEVQVEGAGERGRGLCSSRRTLSKSKGAGKLSEPGNFKSLALF